MKQSSIFEGTLRPFATLTPPLRGSLRTTASALVMLLALTACESGSVQETLGLSRTAPDEFTVVSRPSLSVPPEFNLRPPKPGEPPRGASADEQARAALLGKEAKPTETIDSIVDPKNPTAVPPVLESSGPTVAGDALLKRAGADMAKDDIRDLLGGDAERKDANKEAKSLIERLSGGKKEPVVDAKKEAERLRDNKDKGKPVTEGEVQVEKPKSPTVIDRIF